MGREFRTIVLTADEIDAAIRQYVAAQSGKTVDPATIADIAVTPPTDSAGGFGALVRFSEPRLDGTSEMVLDAETMIAALIDFCRSRAVPLPRGGRKTLGRVNGDLALLVELDWF